MTGPGGGDSNGGGTGPGRAATFPGPPKPHLVDFGWRIELRSRACELLAVAQVRDSGLWLMQTDGREPFFVGNRDQAENAMRELVVAS